MSMCTMQRCTTARHVRVRTRSAWQLALAVWALVLCRHTSQEEVVIGAPYHGRDAAGTEVLIGYFVNMLALRVEVPRGEGSIGIVVRSARAAVLDGMRHAALPFQRIVHELLPRRSHDASRNAVFQAMLAWGAEAYDWSNESGVPFGRELTGMIAPLTEHRAAKVELTLEASEVADRSILGGVSYNTALF